jgi:hypothetical protein
MMPDVEIQEIRALIVGRGFQLIESLKFVTKLSHLALQGQIITRLYGISFREIIWLMYLPKF